MEIVFVMVETVTAGNIGAAARAIKTMGFTDLRLVNCKVDHLSKESIWMAHGSQDILEKASLYKELKDAVADRDFVIGTTARKRDLDKIYHLIDDIPQLLSSKHPLIEKVAVVFGSEPSGLSNAHIAFCDILTTIPMANSFPTVNLSQAVMLYAYVLSGLKKVSLDRHEKVKYSDFEYKAIKEKVASSLTSVGFDILDRSYRKILDRLSLISPEDLRLVADVVNKLDRSDRSRSPG